MMTLNCITYITPLSFLDNISIPYWSTTRSDVSKLTLIFLSCSSPVITDETMRSLHSRSSELVTSFLSHHLPLFKRFRFPSFFSTFPLLLWLHFPPWFFSSLSPPLSLTSSCLCVLPSVFTLHLRNHGGRSRDVWIKKEGALLNATGGVAARKERGQLCKAHFRLVTFMFK